MSVIEGGRFDFDDGGSYVGEWCDGRAHGLGIATGPENQGEYSGEWVMGFESRGVYVWPSGNIYAGGWMKGKRHGEGVQMKGKWIYKGEFTTGFCGRYGVKESLVSSSKYEGSWHLNLFDGFGIETNADESIYSGAWSKGLRQGLGVRRSAPYYKALTHKDPTSVRAAASQNSLLSANDSDRAGYPDNDSRRPNDHRSGFVLVSGCSNVDLNAKEKKPSFRKALFRKLRKQKSTGDLRSARMGGSLRSTVSSNSAASQATNHSLPDTLTMQNREVIDPNAVETYFGQWKDDKRAGYGVADRTDGLRYEGEWYNNKKDGYGVTYFPSGVKEEGRYKENVLVQALHKRNKLFAIRHSRLKDSVEEAVKNALDAAADAKDRAMETANQRAQTARNSAESAEIKAREAQMLSNHSREVAKEFAPDFVQLGVMWIKTKSNIEGRLGGNVKMTNNWLLADIQKYINQNYKPQQTEQLQPNLLNPSDQVCLEVSGGSRRGSFRSSFRRSGEKKPNVSHPQEQLVIQKDVAPQLANQISMTRKPNTHLQNDDNYFLEVPKLTRQVPDKTIQKIPDHTMVIEPHIQKTVTVHVKEKPPSFTANYVSAQTSYQPKIKESFQYAELQHNDNTHPQTALIEPVTFYSNTDEQWHKNQPSEGNADHFEHYSNMVHMNNYGQHKSDAEILDTRAARNQERRKSVPSIMTSKPVPHTHIATTKYKDDDAVHSSEFLNSNTSVYIIENGIRKRLQADDHQLRAQPPLSPKSRRMAGRTEMSPMAIEPEADELAPLPRNYKLESATHLRKKIEGSLPDVSFCNEIKSKTGVLMSRNEASQLSQQRRQELLREQERQRRGEIVIRMADIKDWIKQNYAILIILILNFIIALGFLKILKM